MNIMYIFVGDGAYTVPQKPRKQYITNINLQNLRETFAGVGRCGHRPLLLCNNLNFTFAFKYGILKEKRNEVYQNVKQKYLFN